MLMTNAISKNYILKCGFSEHGHNLLFNKPKYYTKWKNISSLRLCTKLVNLPWLKHHLVSRTCVFKWSSYRYSTAQATFPKKENYVPVKSSFQEIMNIRKIQAHRSVLVEVPEKEDIPFAVVCLQKYGNIANIYSYPGENKNCFLLLEYSSEIDAEKLLSNCKFQNIIDIYPVYSRMLKYEKKSNILLAEVITNVNEENTSEPSFKQGSTLSEVIHNIYLNEKLTELDIRLRFFWCSLMKDAISGIFRSCDVLPFGSTVNGVGKRGCDLDIVIRLYPEKLNDDGEVHFLCKTCVGKHKNLQQRTLSGLGECFLLLPGVSLSEKIMFARVPILKMKHKILNMDFDVSVNNISAVLMSEMLHFCGEVDSRVRPLMHAVKNWAKDSNITLPSPGYQISNFGLINLVLFFLQTRKPHPILPPLNDAFIILGSENYYDFKLQYLKPIEDWKACAALNKETLAMLLKEFLSFLSTYSFHGKIISLLSGEIRTRDEDFLPVYVEYPLDETLNITKNVSKAEYDLMCEKAKISAKYLENNLNRTVNNVKDFSALLGIPSVSRIGLKSSKFNVSSVTENGKNSRNRNLKYKAT